MGSSPIQGGYYQRHFSTDEGAGLAHINCKSSCVSIAIVLAFNRDFSCFLNENLDVTSVEIENIPSSTISSSTRFADHAAVSSTKDWRDRLRQRL